MRIPDLTEIQDLEVVEPANYELTITKVQDIKANTGRNQILLICDINDSPNAETLFHRLNLPMVSDDSGKTNTILRMLKDFIVALGLDPSNTTSQDFVSVSFSALLDIEEYEGRSRNVIKRIL